MTTPFDTSKPNIARRYDYWLGGKDHFEADRRAAEAIRGTRPNVAEQALDNKKFQTRAVSYVASHGVRQFVQWLAPVPPGVVDVSRWQAEQPAVTPTGRSDMIVGGVGRVRTS